VTLFDAVLLGGETNRKVRSFCEQYGNDPAKIGEALLRASKMAEEIKKQDNKMNIS
jgi:hypothetical protein